MAGPQEEQGLPHRGEAQGQAYGLGNTRDGSFGSSAVLWPGARLSPPSALPVSVMSPLGEEVAGR